MKCGNLPYNVLDENSENKEINDDVRTSNNREFSSICFNIS